ncbi:MAG: NAD-dependent succinate-semialdehyde dehydrogenase [Candidatus Marinimicrobia bacterium]|nr:NAD-dependent succinate-semialdehyde dehydrogenase [Candidatus Neomarinimicrobiota bacterium]MBL7023024.1 NAD-dependent succinate-semialdehyde dehydrogenase [Candidatus Neomarinimicrobiota bacterium]MBL7109664.1 NAD-dependent succinate-semialdehyde dehydrogenase [Candidatus Neomarinimicrobiota bacterium]
MKSINPATNEVMKEYTEYSFEQIDIITNEVHKEFYQWRQTSFSERSNLMHQVAIKLRNKIEEYSKLITLEMGKPIFESRAEVEKCAWVCDYYAENTESFLQNEFIETDASKSYIVYDPIGVVLAIMPWNFPFWQVFRFLAPTIMTGNTALLKHASNVSGCAMAIEKIFQESGFPKNTFRTLLIPSKFVKNIIVDKRITAVTLTGSEFAGSSVAEITGKSIKKTVLELGGSDPFIILDDADIDECVDVAITSRFMNAGQSCISAKRFIVVESRIEEFTEKLVQKVKSLKMGNPLDETTQIGPLAKIEFVEEIHKQVSCSVEQGAKLLTDGKLHQFSGNFYPPTILTNVQKGMPVYDEETFGPVLAIIPVKNIEEAIDVANDSEFGLGASLWTSNLENAELLARNIESGSVFINGIVKSDPRLPFGGVKKSGYGRELSHYGIKEFANIKTIWIK